MPDRYYVEYTDERETCIQKFKDDKEFQAFVYFIQSRRACGEPVALVATGELH